MQQLVGPVAQGLVQKLLIQLDNLRVFMGLADHVMLIDLGQSLGPFRPIFPAVGQGLPSPSHAAVGAGHHFDPKIPTGIYNYTGSSTLNAS